MTFRADLHCHSLFSDGTNTPEELIVLAKKNGLSALSITDHDTILAYEDAIPAAKKNKIILGVGAEFSCVYVNLNVHILAYDFDLQSEPIHQFCQKHEERRKQRNQRILDKLNKYKMSINVEELNKIGGLGSIGRPHIAKLMMDHGYVKSIQEAFNHYIGDGKLCYDPGESFSVDETLEIIHGAKGKAFLAHPHLFGEGQRALKVLDKPFDGIECRYSKCLPQQEEKWIKIAKERGLLMSGGSDYHGSIKPLITLGCSWVDEETFYKIFQNPIKFE